jgi:hypothetical protein
MSGKATKGFCVDIRGVPLVVVMKYRYRAETMEGAESMMEREEEEDEEEEGALVRRPRNADEGDSGDEVGAEGGGEEEGEGDEVDHESVDTSVVHDAHNEILITSLDHLTTQLGTLIPTSPNKD